MLNQTRVEAIISALLFIVLVVVAVMVYRDPSHLENPILKGAITGAVVAGQHDLIAFKSWQSVQEAVNYQWSVAVWRWFQGAVLGAGAAVGLGQLGM